MESKKYCVYMHTTPSGKVYIGLTCKKPHRRWANGCGYRNQQYFYRAIQKYGWKNMHHIIVQENLSQTQASELEKQLIKLFDSTNPEKGYNISHGGEFSENRIGVSFSEEVRAKISAHNKGKILSEETRKKMSASRSGSKNWAYGKTFSAEYRKKLSESHMGQIQCNAKKVQCVETKEIFSSISEAQRTKSINNIGLVCDNPNRTSGGFHWISYVERKE